MVCHRSGWNRRHDRLTFQVLVHPNDLEQYFLPCTTSPVRNGTEDLPAFAHARHRPVHIGYRGATVRYRTFWLYVRRLAWMECLLLVIHARPVELDKIYLCQDAEGNLPETAGVTGHGDYMRTVQCIFLPRSLISIVWNAAILLILFIFMVCDS